DEAELGPPLPHLLLEGAAGRRPGDAVVLLHIGLVVKHAVEPFACRGPRPGQGDHVDLGRRDTALLEESIDGEGGIPRVVLEAREALFGRAAHDTAVTQNGRGGAVGFVDSKDDHSRHYTLDLVPSPLTLISSGRGKDLRSGLGRLEGERQALVIATDEEGQRLWQGRRGPGPPCPPRGQPAGGVAAGGGRRGAGPGVPHRWSGRGGR